MKHLLSVFIIFIAACNNKEPVAVPKPVETVWIDADMYSDTIITNVGDNPGTLYYAIKDWQLLSANSNSTHGYRYIAGSQADTVVVYKLNYPANAQSFICGNSIYSDTLKSQNFLDTLLLSPVRNFVQLK